MKLLNFFTFIFLALATASVVAEYDKVVCPSGMKPVLVPGGWQCQSAQPGESSIVYPKQTVRAGFDNQYECRLRPEYQTDYVEVEEEVQPNTIRRGPFIASELQ